MKDEEYIYIALEASHTFVGTLSRIFEHYEYCHCVVCMDENLDSFASFSRRRLHAPFDSGFMRETLDCFAFGKNDSVKLKVFKIPVTHRNKVKIERFITTVEKDDAYIFNFFSAFTMAIFHGFRIYKTYNCMSFVGKVLELSGAVEMSKPYYKYDIKEIDALLSDYLYNEGKYECKEVINKHYMDKVNPIANVYMFFKLIFRLIYRVIFLRDKL